MEILDQSGQLARHLSQLTQDLVLASDQPRAAASAVAVSLGLEHWDALRSLLASGMLPSAVVVHRAQFESTLRSVWLAYAASDEDVRKLSAVLDVESEQSARNMLSAAAMMGALVGKAPPQAIDAFNRFKINSWNALNSYVHTGIHALSRHRDGYPRGLLENVLRNANGLGVLGYFQRVALHDRQHLQREILAIAQGYGACLPPRIV